MWRVLMSTSKISTKKTAAMIAAVKTIPGVLN